MRDETYLHFCFCVFFYISSINWIIISGLFNFLFNNKIMTLLCSVCFEPSIQKIRLPYVVGYTKTRRKWTKITTEWRLLEDWYKEGETRYETNERRTWQARRMKMEIKGRSFYPDKELMDCIDIYFINN